MNIAHCIVNNLGGISTLVQNLILYAQPNNFEQKLYCLNITDNKNEPAFFPEQLKNKTINFILNPKDNWYRTYGKLAKSLSHEDGVLVSNDQFDLIMLQAFNIPRKVVQLVHDPYNIELSKKYHEVIDGFIAHNRDIYNQLNNLFPHRKKDIHFQPYGIPLDFTLSYQKNRNKRLKLIFIGRHDKEKGIYDLYKINQKLKLNGIEVDWTILGKGPETKNLKIQWADERNVLFHLAIDNKEVLKYALENDILVFPTKFEGSPVALLEAMSMGCVPVVTALPGGITETIENGVNGFTCGINQIDEFVNAIEKMHDDRITLYNMQARCREKIISDFDILNNTDAYMKIFNLYAEAKGNPIHHFVNKKIGSRLDQWFVPNLITSFIRTKLNFKLNV